jgi:DHA3 family macrolide efflux protein-like MFS transporter
MKTIINKNYTKILMATFITRFGDSIDTIAFSWLVYVMTGSRALMGGIFAISILPNIIVLPFGGVIADMFNKKLITIFGDIMRAVSVTILAFLYFFDLLEVWHLFMFVSINSLFESLANPARSSMLPSLIEQEDYLRGSSWLGTSSQFGSLIGLGVSSAFIALFGIGGTILIDAFTFIFSAGLITFISFKDNRGIIEQKPKVKDYFILIKEGFMYLKTKKVLMGILLLAAFLNFAIVPLNVLRPVYVTEVLNLGVEGLGYLGMATLAGMIIGGYIVGLKGGSFNAMKMIIFGMTLVGIFYMLLGIPEYSPFGQITNTVYVILVSFLMGASIPIVNAPIQALIMKNTAPEMIGRLSSIMGVIGLCAMPLGGVFVSLIGDSISVTLLFIIMGISSIVAVAIFGYNNSKRELV